MARRRKKNCLACRRDAEIRGLCRACYQAARYAMETGKATEEELVDRGVLLEPNATPQSEYGSLLKHILANPRRNRSWKTNPPNQVNRPKSA